MIAVDEVMGGRERRVVRGEEGGEEGREGGRGRRERGRGGREGEFVVSDMRK